MQNSVILNFGISSPLSLKGTATSLYIESMSECTPSSLSLTVGLRNTVAQNREVRKQ